MSRRSKTVHNEQLKLAATAFNNLGVAVIVTGIIVPVVALAYQTAVPKTRLGGFCPIMEPRRRCPAPHCEARDRKAGRMTPLEIYGLAAPVLLLAFCGLGAWWIVRH